MLLKTVQAEVCLELKSKNPSGNIQSLRPGQSSLLIAEIALVTVAGDSNNSAIAFNDSQILFGSVKYVCFHMCQLWLLPVTGVISQIRQNEVHVY